MASIVSHGQWGLVQDLLSDIATHCNGSCLEIILTLNLPEEIAFDFENYLFNVTVIKNGEPLGFGENHNQAFANSEGEFFCVLNPDIRLKSNPFVQMLPLFSSSDIGIITPQVRNNDNELEGNGRPFPGPFKILLKLFGISKMVEYEKVGDLMFPDWVGGMFMFIPSKIFQSLNGFDERYFLYYEDVDICARLHLLGYKPVVYTQLFVIHNARRDSHKRFKYFKWHLTSMLRFFLSKPYWKLIIFKNKVELN